MAEDWKQKYESKKAAVDLLEERATRHAKEYSSLENRFFDIQTEVRNLSERAIKAETRADRLLQIVSNLSEGLAHKKS